MTNGRAHNGPARAHDKMSNPKRHHYLPESYLQGFSENRRNLWVYDINQNALRAQTTHDTCVQSYYNALVDRDGQRNFEIEKMLGGVEGDAAGIIRQIDAGDQITLENKAALAYFVSLQRVRTPDFEADVNKSASHMMNLVTQMTWADEERAQAALDQLAQRSGVPAKVTAKEMVEFTARGEYDLKIHRNLSLETMIQMAPEFAEYFVQMEWVFVRAPEDSAFIVTDSPFMLIEPSDWRKDGPPYLPAGLLTKGARKFFPLSARTCLVMFDKGFVMSFRQATATTVQEINDQLAAFAYRFVIGPNEDLIKSTSERVRNLLDSRKVKWGGSKLAVS
jgi:hypothetical protein